MIAGVSTANWLRIAALGVIWGASFMFTSIAIAGFGPLTVAAGRISLAAFILISVAIVTGRGLPKWRGENGPAIWAAAVAMGILSNALPFFLLSWAQGYVASGWAGVNMAAVPLIILPLAHLLVPGERLSLRKALGFILGFLGVLLLIGLDAFKSLGSDLEGLARLAVLGVAICYAFGAIITRLCPKVDMISLAAATLLSAAVIIVPVAVLKEGLPTALPVLPTTAILVLGIFPTALAQFLLVQVTREAGPSFFSLTNYQVPVWSVIFGATLLGESLPPQLFAALGLILSGIAISQFRRPARTPARSD